jgi:hypothetical protein
MLDAPSSVVHSDECGTLLIVVLLSGKNCSLVLLVLVSDGHFTHGQKKAEHVSD